MNKEIDEEIGMIGESDARLILEVLQNLEPSYGYKAKKQKAIKAILETIWGIDWEKREQECTNFLKQWRAEQNKKAA